MKGMLKDTAIIFAITILAGAILGFVFELTKEPIAIQEAKAKSEACQEVFPDAAEFVTVMSDSGALGGAGQTSENVIGSADGPTSIFLAGEDDGSVSINEVMTAADASGNVLGYVITVTSHEGYGGDIQFSMGIRNDGTLNGISILSISETAGLGMQAEDVLKPQFANRKAEQFVYTKTGASADNEINAISGATITTNAVTNGVNAGMGVFHALAVLEGGAVNE